MKQSTFFSVVLAGAGCFFLGTLVGYFAGTRREAQRDSAHDARLAASRDGEETSTVSSLSRDSSRSRSHGGWRGKGAEKSDEWPDGADHEIGEDNPFRDKNAAEIIAVLNATRHGRGEQYGQAMEALRALVREDPLAATPLLSKIRNQRAMHELCRELAISGGKDGVKAVVDYILSAEGNVHMRGEAIGALGSLPPEMGPLASSSLQELMTQSLPRDLQHRLCHSYGEISGDGALPNLLSLLGDETCRLRPEVIVQTLDRFAGPEHQEQLLELLSQGSLTRDMQHGLLRAIASSAEDSNILLDMLETPRDGVSSRIVAETLADVADRGGLDQTRLLEALGSDLDPETKRNLARALVKSGGEEGMGSLWDMAGDETSGIDADSLGAALAEAGGQEMIPSMVDMLRDVRSWDTAHKLARSVVEAGGRDGVEALLGLMEEGKVSDERLRPLCEVLSSAGTPADAERLFEHVSGARGWDDARPLIESASKLAGPGGIEQCLELVRGAEAGGVRAAAADVLAREARGQHVPELLQALGQEDFGRAQWHLAQAIYMGGDEGVGQLTEFFSQDSNVGRRHAVIDAVGKLDGYSRSPFLSQALSTASRPEVRMHAAKILAGIGDETAVAALEQAIQNEANPQMQKALSGCLNEAQGRPSGE